MTDKAQTPELDVKTLEYVLSLIDNKRKAWEDVADDSDDEEFVQKLKNGCTALVEIRCEIRQILWDKWGNIEWED